MLILLINCFAGTCIYSKALSGYNSIKQHVSIETAVTYLYTVRLDEMGKNNIKMGWIPARDMAFSSKGKTARFRIQSAVVDPGKGPRGRSSQGSPQILAQQVRDHSWTVRQKIYTFLGGGGVWVGQWREGHGPRPHWEIFLFPYLKTYFTQICCHVIFRQQIKTFDSNNFTMSLMSSFQNACPWKGKLYIQYSPKVIHVQKVA